MKTRVLNFAFFKFAKFEINEINESFIYLYFMLFIWCRFSRNFHVQARIIRILSILMQIQIKNFSHLYKQPNEWPTILIKLIKTF